MRDGFFPGRSGRCFARPGPGRKRKAAFFSFCLSVLLCLSCSVCGTAQAALRTGGAPSETKKPAFLPLGQPEDLTGSFIGMPAQPEAPGLEMPALPPVAAPQEEDNESDAPEADEAHRQGTVRTPHSDSPRAQRPPADARERELQRRGIVRAELRPGRPLFLSAPFPGLLVAVLVHDGEQVTEGQVIARFDTQTAERSVEEAKKALAEAVERVQSTRDGSPREREGAEEYLARCADQLREAEERLALSTLAAPFAGRVTEVRARAGQHLKRGDVIAELAEEGDLEILSTVPSLWIKQLAPGHIIWVYVEESAKSYEAEFVRFGGRVDPTTRTIRAYARFLEPPAELLPGMSGRADFFPRPRNLSE